MLKSNKKKKIASIEDADIAITDLRDRINTLERHVNSLYTMNSKASKSVSSSLNDFNTDIRNVNRKISQNPKK